MSDVCSSDLTASQGWGVRRAVFGCFTGAIVERGRFAGRVGEVAVGFNVAFYFGTIGNRRCGGGEAGCIDRTGYPNLVSLLQIAGRIDQDRRCAADIVAGGTDRKSTPLNTSHYCTPRLPSY